jgi:hypothetical protein
LPAIPISTIRRAAGDRKEQRNPVFVEIAVYFVAQAPKKINFPAERVIGFTVITVNGPLDAVEQKRQQVKQAKYPVRMFLPVPVGNCFTAS